jgi:hypothetical protein
MSELVWEDLLPYRFWTKVCGQSYLPLHLMSPPKLYVLYDINKK